MDEQHTIEERRRYVEAYNDTMVKIWQERIRQLGVYETPRRKYRRDEPHLYDELRYFPVKHDDKYLQLTLHFSFPEYGIFQDLGVGREKYRGNPGDIGDTTKAGHERKYRARRKWFSTKWYASVMNMKDFMARSIGNSFVGICSETFEKLNKYN